MIRDPLTEEVIGLAIEVHRALGPGLLESIYESCLCLELTANNIEHHRQVPIPITYKGSDLGPGFRADIVVRRALLIEVKSVEQLAAVHDAQILSYLRLGGFPTGLLINFNVALLKNGVRRFVQ